MLAQPNACAQVTGEQTGNGEGKEATGDVGVGRVAPLPQEASEAPRNREMV